MSSVNYEKLGDSRGTLAVMRHCCTDERLKHNHSNQHIDKSLTESNVSYGHGGSYPELCLAYHARIAELDATTNTNKRKDRQTCFSLCVTRPEDLPLDQVDAWTKDVYDMIENIYGADNVLGGVLHRDEIHDYRDHGEEKTSREHVHIFVVPEIDGTLNGKKFSSKSAMKALNKDIDSMTQSKYHVRFMTGEMVRGKTVEELKAASAKEELEYIRERIETAVEYNKDASERAQELREEVQDLTAERDALQREIEEQRRLYADLEEKRRKLRKKYKREKEDLEEEYERIR